eukprot:16441209-Heterocapsa_arctica.AAC.1
MHVKLNRKPNAVMTQIMEFFKCNHYAEPSARSGVASIKVPSLYTFNYYAIIDIFYYLFDAIEKEFKLCGTNIKTTSDISINITYGMTTKKLGHIRLSRECAMHTEQPVTPDEQERTMSVVSKMQTAMKK